MKDSVVPIFMYPLWVRVFGFMVIAAAIGIFLYRWVSFGVVDISAASSPLAIGLIMIYFSRGKVVDERLIYLKFKALSIAVPIAALLVMLVNYTRNFSNYSIETDSWYSLSAFEYLSIALIFSIVLYNYLKIRE